MGKRLKKTKESLADILKRQVEGIRNRDLTSEKNVQTLKTPVNEMGVELDPPTPVDLVISPYITRAWSTLWGWTGSVLKMLRVSHRGVLEVQEPSIFWGNMYYASFELVVGDNVEIDLGANYDWVQVFVPDALYLVSFNMKEGEAYSRRGPNRTVVCTDRTYNIVEAHIRFRKLTIWGIEAGAELTGYVVANSIG